MTLRPTFVPPQEPAWAAPGGPWDVATLDVLLTAPLLDPSTVRDDVVVTAAEAWSSARIEAEVAQLASALRTSGVDHGDVVAWQLPSGVGTVLLLRACWRLGAVAAPLHPRAGPAEVAAMLELLQPRAVARSETEVIDWATRSDPGGIPPVEPGASQARPEDVAVVLFTAGSTGRPKGVLHTHRSLAYKTVSMIETHGLSGADAVLMPAPLAHVSGLLNGVLVPGAAGMRSVIMQRWSPAEALHLVAEHSVSFMVGPPTLFLTMMDDPSFSPEGVRSLRVLSCGGAGVSEAFVLRATETLGAIVKRSYGSTEAPTVATSTAADPLERRAGFDGRAVGRAELLVVDRERRDSSPLGPGAEGELLVRGPELFAGYLSSDDNIGALTEDGWFRTGDLAHVDAGGWLTIGGRLKEVIIRSGENVSVAEVEGTLEAHPNVRQAAVVGRPDAVVGERVVAFVVTSAEFDLAACRAWFEEQGVTRFKTPEDVIVVEELPLLPAGKVDRMALRDLTPRPD
jgi:acyl-CoA synthetase (AMP-forming)/AMP-acid ligase II